MGSANTYCHSTVSLSMIDVAYGSNFYNPALSWVSGFMRHFPFALLWISCSRSFLFFLLFNSSVCLFFLITSETDINLTS